MLPNTVGGASGKAQAAVERPEAASKETEEAEERAILAADRLEAAEKKVKTKKNAAKVELWGNDLSFILVHLFTSTGQTRLTQRLKQS